ncbi:hypothetical protein NLU13_0003 [Sarocladium strictum]|uniref:Hexosyltransferase n=1 Tax=Sarocladium strictum TaxID=5046 RepID=A0AA39LB38_SARSR|nr:hypothetical protein NLU13_0003 [Sarocladium strictum]
MACAKAQVCCLWCSGVDKPPEKIIRPEYLPSANSEAQHKFAYMLWLSNTPENDTENFDADRYFVASRVLLWQLFHDPVTKASKDIDVIVMCGPRVGEAHKERLRQDGAIIHTVDVPHTPNDGWISPEESRWGDIMGKLHAWELEEYSRILLLDGDIILQSPLDDIFNDPGVVTMRTKSGIGRKSDEPDLPDEYLLCGFMELNSRDHDWPPSDRGRTPGYFNAGFFMLQPNKKIYKYFIGLLDIPNRFDSRYMEQNLLNYAHRWDGAMPWKEINAKWNAKLVMDQDLEGGLVSLHEKWWDLIYSATKTLGNFASSKKFRAEGYWQAEKELQQHEKN